MRVDSDAVEVARRIGEEVLFPAAMAVDRADAVPTEQLALLAEAGLYGLAGPAEAGGLDADLLTLCSVVEVLASASLATTLVWVQHHGLVRVLAGDAPPALKEAWLAPLCRGERRAGLALAGLLPGRPRLRAVPAGGGWVLEGESPWVTGWGLIDVLHLAARGPDDSLVWLMVDAVERPGVEVRRQRLVAADASVTVHLDFAGLEVPGDRLLAIEPYDPAASMRPHVLRVNGSLALGVAMRCCRLLGPSPLDGDLEAARQFLDDSAPDELPVARAAASELAYRAAATLTVHTGSRAVLIDQHPQRLAREALLLLVFGSRPAIREALLERIAGFPQGSSLPQGLV
jgi:alkylation response protein AidB-like acyl-CoA dehydrogenase